MPVEGNRKMSKLIKLVEDSTSNEKLRKEKLAEKCTASDLQIGHTLDDFNPELGVCDLIQG